MLAIAVLALKVAISVLAPHNRANRLAEQAVKTVTKTVTVTLKVLRTVGSACSSTAVFKTTLSVLKTVLTTVTYTETETRTETVTATVVRGANCINATKTVYQYVTAERVVTITTTVPAECTLTVTETVTVTAGIPEHHTTHTQLSTTGSENKKTHTTICGIYKVSGTAVCLNGIAVIPRTHVSTSTVVLNIFGSSTVITEMATTTTYETITCLSNTITTGTVSGCVLLK